MSAPSTSPAEFDFAYVMKRYERAYVRIFALDLTAEIKEAEGFGIRTRTLDSLYANLQPADFARGYAALADASEEKELLAYRKVRSGAISTAFATAKLKEVDAELPEFGALPFNLAVECRLGEKLARINGNDFDRLLWRLYGVFCEPSLIEVTARRSRQLIFLLGLNALGQTLSESERERWAAADWPQLTAETIASLLKGSAVNFFNQNAWEQL